MKVRFNITRNRGEQELTLDVDIEDSNIDEILKIIKEVITAMDKETYENSKEG